MIIYGTMLCKDCVECRKDLDEAGIVYEYREITADLTYMKEFLKLRDTLAVFEPVKAEGKIGIPCIVRDTGEVSFDWK